MGYDPGHPWYYKLGGRILWPSEIKAEVLQSGGRGYLDREIDKICQMPTDKRPKAIAEMRARICSELRQDLKGYRRAARSLRWRRDFQGPTTWFFDTYQDPITAMSLKFCHVYNGMANLNHLDSLNVEIQWSLF